MEKINKTAGFFKRNKIDQWLTRLTFKKESTKINLK